MFVDNFSIEQTQALILIGSYGKREGGVVYEDNMYKPHNNLDLLYIYNGKIDSTKYQEVTKKLKHIAEEYNIGIDLSAINKQKLLELKGLVISYDMRFGHITVLGDSQFLKQQSEFNVYNIDPIDIRQLLVNRGTLLLINRLILRKEILSEKEKTLIIKHIMKAILGYGDAFLYFNDNYHWSCAQKQLNMSKLSNAPREL